ncbi:N-alpha-acetyltransferase 20 [Exophiala xenobiotica]|uniref:N-alpha-acetyltransferase 20 n=1 Tax=Lithohypha guttulata TaxID=1690604 RepID=A0ABR0JUN0_9EURO|nr:N-alpha-acetyltransferase 20 [Lithohypha guttulata]KAK5309410.1 N-alpha-acetyltransferase 20 [Exophiala xenobiotica]
MPVIRRVKPADLFHLNLCNLDPYTENYDISFYLSYLMKWPSLFFCLEENSQIVGYIIGKVEASPGYLQGSEHYLPWHGHVTALTIAPQYRRLGYARLLTRALEKACEQQNAWFVDLFVRESNTSAIKLYESLGYSVFRRVVDYYSDDIGGSMKGEDAFDMRIPLPRDKERQHIRENGRNFRVTAEDVF